MNVYEALTLGLTAGNVKDELASGGREPLTAQWGKVDEDGHVVLDDGAVLPEDVPSLAPLHPGRRVVVHRSGRGLWVDGSVQSPVMMTPGVGPDEMTLPGQYVLRDATLATTAAGFPEQGAGWLLVQGDGDTVFQQYTLESNGTVYHRRRVNGTWSAWQTITERQAAVTLYSPWKQYDDTSSWGPPYCSVVGTQVQVSGMVTGGMGGMSEAIGQVPEFARSARNRIVAGVVNGVVADFQINPAGDIYLRYARPSLPTWVSLNLAYRI